MLVNELNTCKGNLNRENSRLEELEKQLVAAEKHTDKIRYPILINVIGSFILNTFGHIIMNPFVVLTSLLMLGVGIPAYVVFMVRDSKSGKIEEAIKECKENIQKYEEELSRLNYRYEVENLIKQNENTATYKEPTYAQRITEAALKKNNSRQF